MRASVLVLSLYAAASLGCASRPAPAPEPAAKRPPRRPPRRPGVPSKPGQRELEAAIQAAKDGNLDLAIERCNAAIDKNAQLEHAYLLLGSSCAMKGDSACEKAAYERGLEALPRSAPLHRELGLWHLGQGEIDAAVARYEQAHELSGGQEPEYMADLAYAYVYAGKVDDAVRLAERALALDPRCYTCAISLGQARLTKRSFDAAAEAYKKALELDPKSADAEHGLAKAEFLAGRLGNAAKHYANLIAAHPEDYRLRVQAAQVAMARKKYAEAAKNLKVVADANPGEKGLLELLLEAQTKAKDRKGAAETQRALEKLRN